MTTEKKKPSVKSAAKSEPPKSAQCPSVSELNLPEHFPEAIDLRPYTPEIGDTFEHHVSAALTAVFARTGRPLPFVPSPEHIAAVGSHEGIGKYGIREIGVRIGEQPTEYDLTADSIPLDVRVFNVDSIGTEKVKLACTAFASGSAVRIGDGFLLAYRNTEDGLVLTLSDGRTLSTLDEHAVHVWTVRRV